MLYQLVLITNLGAIQPVMVFPTRDECIREAALIGSTAQASARCLPTQSPEQLQKQLETNFKLMIETINKVKDSQK